MKIAITGAPASGKTVFCARLYAELLERGLHRSRLASEYAHEFIAAHGGISSIDQQCEVSNKQKEREDWYTQCEFSPIVCDSPLWVTNVYLDIHDKNQVDEEILSLLMREWSKHNDRYDIVIYVPMFDSDTDKSGHGRIHDNVIAQKIDKLICDYINKNITNSIILECPKSLKDRDYFVKYAAAMIHEKIFQKGS